ncbi:MAG: hypothetical protein RL226_1479 [Bacteroidota bacterium]|jgi:hypothetical protein
MELKKILSISGKSGLFRLVSSIGTKIIVESLSDNKKMPVNPAAKISSLGDISIFTTEEDVPLERVFGLIKEKTNGQAALDPKVASPAELRAFVGEILPDLDHDRVYDSDLRKLFTWFNQLLAAGLLVETDTAEEELAKAVSTEVVKPKKAPRKKAAKGEASEE